MYYRYNNIILILEHAVNNFFLARLTSSSSTALLRSCKENLHGPGHAYFHQGSRGIYLRNQIIILLFITPFFILLYYIPALPFFLLFPAIITNFYLFIYQIFPNIIIRRDPDPFGILEPPGSVSVEFLSCIKELSINRIKKIFVKLFSPNLVRGIS